MKILSIGYGRSLFDAEDPERERLRACAEAAGEVHHIVFTRRKDGKEYVRAGASLHLYPTASRLRVGMFFAALRIGARIIKTQQGPWIITAQDPLISGLVAYILARRFRLPLVLQEHGDIFSGTYWRNETLAHRCLHPLARFLIRRATLVRVVSARVARHVQALGVDALRIRQLAVFSDLGHMQEQAVATDLRDQFPPGACIVLSVARFVPQKNLSMLLEAFSVFSRETPRARLVLVGRGPLEKFLRKKAETLGIADVVTFMPWVGDVASLMKSSDIYALTSNYEGWARVLPEAMACGLPAVTTDVGCVGEVFIHNRHGIVVPVGDKEAYARALQALESSVDRVRMETAAHVEVARLSQNLASYAKAWADVYSGLDLSA